MQAGYFHSIHKTMFDRIIHRWLRIPYTLNVHYFCRPDNPKSTILLVHGLGTSWRTWKPLEPHLPKDTQVIAIDMLGFSNSPKPDWKSYNVQDQATSIAATLRHKSITHLDIVIGHSMGSLAAVELAKKYPKLAQSLILCSPPIYQPKANEKIHHPEKYYGPYIALSTSIRGAQNVYYSLPTDIIYGPTRDLRPIKLLLNPS